MMTITATTTAGTDTAEKKPARRKKRRRVRPRNDPVSYIVEVTEWDWSFMFGAGASRLTEGTYSDYRHLNLRGNLIQPDQVKASEVEITVLPDRRLNEGDNHNGGGKPYCGSLNLHRGHFQALLPMPLDVLPCVLQMAVADRLRYVVITGDKLRYGRGSVHIYRLQRTIDEDDLAAD
jgi:hypothetical protein